MTHHCPQVPLKGIPERISMKIAQLFARKTNPTQQPRCCHKRNDGTECKPHPRRGTQYCFLHHPPSQKKRAAASPAAPATPATKAPTQPSPTPRPTLPPPPPPD